MEVNSSDSAAQGRVVVIGGGVIGAACAFYLSQAGRKVIVIDKGDFGKGCSHGNCGLVCPSHVLPLTAPGMVRETLKRMFHKRSPLYIKPRIDLGLWRWLAAFARRCNEDHMLHAARAKQALLISSMSLYEQLQQAALLDCQWQRRGLLFVYRSKKAWKEYARTNDFLTESFQLTAQPYDSEQMVELEPALKPGLAGGWHYSTDAHLRPDKLLPSFRGLLEQRDVEVVEQQEATEFLTEGQRALAIRCGANQYAGDLFILAAGAWTPRWRKQLGVNLPIQPGKGYSITMTRPKQCPNIPLMFEEHKVAATPLESGYRLGSTMEFSGYDHSLNAARLKLLREAAPLYLQQPFGDAVEEEWRGFRPMTSDDLPIIGRSPRLENVLIASGHGMLGVSMAPATGKLTAELAVGASPHVDPQPYSPTRF